MIVSVSDHRVTVDEGESWPGFNGDCVVLTGNYSTTLNMTINMDETTNLSGEDSSKVTVEYVQTKLQGLQISDHEGSMKVNEECVRKRMQGLKISDESKKVSKPCNKVRKWSVKFSRNGSGEVEIKTKKCINFVE